ncbi:unnamed protein product [Echinostoma caproni]|uniref:Uncharacterized protein n=1 Tax=Echinostoma caproni TaxID=27848 RepID=A0A183BFZ1_9TREM|nr:unnamed protein product [Echinostoma caproni]
MTSVNQPSKNEITAILTKLKSLPYNKVLLREFTNQTHICHLWRVLVYRLFCCSPRFRSTSNASWGRAAELYRTKLEKLALNAMKIHGTKLLIDTSEEKPESPTGKETDFFKEHTEVNPRDLEGASLSTTKPSLFLGTSIRSLERERERERSVQVSKLAESESQRIVTNEIILVR